VIFNKIEIRNFGPFYGDNVLDTKVDGDRNVTIVLAQNYVGKTSILRSIIWCLYGKTIKDDNNSDVEILNSQAIEDKKYECSVSIYLMHNEKEFLIEREMKRKYLSNGKVDDNLYIRCFEIDSSGHHNPINKAQEIINEWAPSVLSKFFFLKGENSPMNQTESDLSKSVKEILGFDLIERGVSELKSVEASFRKSSAKYVEDKKVKILNEKIEHLEEDIENYENKINLSNIEIKSLKEYIDLQEEKLGDYNKKIGEKKNLREISKLIEEQETQLKDIQKRKALWFREGIYSFVAKKIVTSGMDKINTDLAKGKIPDRYQSDFIREILDSGSCICGTKLKEGDEKYTKVENLMEKGADQRTIEFALEAKSSVRFLKDNKAKMHDSLDNLIVDEQRLQKSIESYKKQKKEQEEKLGKYNDEEARKILIDKKQKESLRSSELRKRTTFEQLLKKAQSDLVDYIKQHSKIASENIEAKKRLDLSKFAGELRKNAEFVVKSMHENARSEIKKEMEKIIKASLTEAPKIEITDRFTYDVGEYYLSGGPKRVIDFAFTSAMLSFNSKGSEILEYTGMVIPLVIDSAFGETDEEYRKSLAKFLPELAPQVIVLVSGTQSYMFADQLKGKINKKYVLQREVRETAENENKGSLLFDGVEYETKVFNCEKERTLIKEI
jgi:DNA sulfur modification protein DndD